MREITFEADDLVKNGQRLADRFFVLYHLTSGFVY